jgi:DNA repair protein RadC
MSIHDGHRQRMRNRFQKEGLANFEPHEVLELLLYFSIPRSDTNEIAHNLIKRYKTVGRVLQASDKELQSFGGIGENTTFFLSLLNEANRYINAERTQDTQMLYTVEDYGSYLLNLFKGVAKETVYLLCLDAKSAVLGHYEICEGSVTSVNLPVREIVNIALNANAASVILAHNHPGGFAIPSREDELATQHLANVLRGIDVILADHVIFSENDYISMAQSSLYKQEIFGIRY